MLASGGDRYRRKVHNSGQVGYLCDILTCICRSEVGSRRRMTNPVVRPPSALRIWNISAVVVPTSGVSWVPYPCSSGGSSRRTSIRVSRDSCSIFPPNRSPAVYRRRMPESYIRRHGHLARRRHSRKQPVVRRRRGERRTLSNLWDKE